MILPTCPTCGALLKWAETGTDSMDTRTFEPNHWKLRARRVKFLCGAETNEGPPRRGGIIWEWVLGCPKAMETIE